MSVRPGELGAALVARHRVARADHARRAAALLPEIERRLREALRAGVVRRAWIIGTLAWGGFGARSDVDVVVEGAEPEPFAQLWGTLGEGLAVEVDLLRLEELPESFRERVVREGRRIDGP